MPVLTLFGGPNGSGKTTLARAWIHRLPQPWPRFLNADEIARGLSPFDPERLAREAGRLLLRDLKAALKKGESVALESTLSGLTLKRMLLDAKSSGYRINLHYLYLPSAKLSFDRIAKRVSHGGHHVAREIVIRRYHRSVANFLEHYLPLADRWRIWDNDQDPPVTVVDSAWDHPAAAAHFLQPPPRVMDRYATYQRPRRVSPEPAPFVDTETPEFIQGVIETFHRQLNELHFRYNVPLVVMKDGKITEIPAQDMSKVEPQR